MTLLLVFYAWVILISTLLVSSDSAIDFDSLRGSWILEVHNKSSFTDEFLLNLAFRVICCPIHCLAESKCLQQGRRILFGTFIG
jgi:hypothetical protein